MVFDIRFRLVRTGSRALLPLWSPLAFVAAAPALATDPPPGGGGGGGNGIGAAVLIDGTAALWCAAAVAGVLLLRHRRAGEGADPTPAWAALVATAGTIAVGGHVAGLPGALVLLAGALSVVLLVRHGTALDRTFVREHGPLLTLPLVVAALAASSVLDAVLTHLFAAGLAAFFTVGGTTVVAAGTTLHGLGTPLFVTAACTGTLVTVMPWAVAAVTASLLPLTGGARWQFATAFAVIAAVANFARVALVGIALVVSGTEAGVVAHDVLGWVIAAVVYGGLGATSLHLVRRRAKSHP
jgi:exosortase/archaeosortase family protein